MRLGAFIPLTGILAGIFTAISHPVLGLCTIIATFLAGLYYGLQAKCPYCGDNIFWYFMGRVTKFKLAIKGFFPCPTCGKPIDCRCRFLMK